MMSHNSVGAGVVSQNSGTPSEEDEKTAGSGVGTMNGHEKASADPQTILVDSSGKQQEQANNNNEALAPASVEVPIEQTNYGHDASTNSPDRNYSKITKSSEADVKAAGKSTTSYTLCASSLARYHIIIMSTGPAFELMI